MSHIVKENSLSFQKYYRNLTKLLRLRNLFIQYSKKKKRKKECRWKIIRTYKIQYLFKNHKKSSQNLIVETIHIFVNLWYSIDKVSDDTK